LLNPGLAEFHGFLFAEYGLRGENPGSSSCDHASIGTSQIIPIFFTGSSDISMTYPAHQSNVQINRVHNQALCREIGERLGISLGRKSDEMSLSLTMLVGRLHEGLPDTQPVEKSLKDGSHASPT
jgi:hypothetical protein